MVAGIIKICIVLSLTVATPIKQIPLTKKVIDVGIYDPVPVSGVFLNDEKVKLLVDTIHAVQYNVRLCELKFREAGKPIPDNCKSRLDLDGKPFVQK
ncbi:hypothetical protein PRIPAC_71181 [Pristionchus pacificus]|uniref:Uncharacterized protein n=1 Tax=Pristionchus pacificus TaxID=54126 RepID=A0A2A6CEN4_PRIPA|nr:hypothetical protein PRIPAC_71181 [Pristionchus pacificus]|eukprot:PDM76695.1 hypothetical protein PRIPAC_42090 [Pristionchus pacificus]